MSGGGVGVDYSDIRPYGSRLSRSGGIASGPLPLIEMVNSIAAAARQGGERRGACYASLRWDHQDILDFIKLKEDGNTLQHTNISPRFNTAWQQEVTKGNQEALAIFHSTLKRGCKYGDPGFQFDPDEQVLRNACTEIISREDSDSCCIGSINLAAISSLSELSDVTNLAILFLLCNTMYTDFPTPQVAAVKTQNRRLGLGLMGIAEWFMQRGLPYGLHFAQGQPTYPSWAYHGPDKDIGQWLQTWQTNCDNAALHWSNKLSVNRPVATRAIAPTGTISIMGHTTPGIEPVFHTAYQRTSNTLKTKEYRDGYKREIVVDPIVSKWISDGYNVDTIDTAYTLSQSLSGIERRLAFQAYVQQFVDNAISSTVNLPAYTDGMETALAPILLKYLPHLRGVTFYPDGRHTNQPVIPVDIHDIYPDNLYKSLSDQQYNHVTLQEGPGCSSGECGL
jgi:ribonucleoside-diphosphate reductase alpha chain